jgi:UDP-GlcNAc:undecaprenyl-phosphate GlcNAc-1-phosphate transferase
LLVQWFIACATAFGVALLSLSLLLPAARRLGLVDHPGGRKDHAAPTPVSGGLAVAAGVLVASIFFLEPAPELTALGIAAAILLVVGVLDDMFDLRWTWRVLAQVAAALVLIYVGGVRVEHLGPISGFDSVDLGGVDLGWVSVPFTILATVGLINALNMCDGVDGLAGGSTLCGLAMLAAAAAYSSNFELLQLLVVAIAALGAFQLLNMRFPWQPRARVFLGNSGSALLGLFLAYASFRLTQNPGHPVTPILAPFLIAPPVIDCLVLVARRIRQGRSPFAADRGHMHHLMLQAGASPTTVVLMLCFSSLSIGLAAAVCLRAEVPPPVFLLSFTALTIGYFLLTSAPARALSGGGRLGRRLEPAARMERVRS